MKQAAAERQLRQQLVTAKAEATARMFIISESPAATERCRRDNRKRWKPSPAGTPSTAGISATMKTLRLAKPAKAETPIAAGRNLQFAHTLNIT